MTKITVDSKSFVEALQWATKNFDSRDEKASVALTVDGRGVGSVFHANSTSFLKSHFTVLDSDIAAGDEFKLSLQGQYVQRLAMNLDPTGPSELHHKDGALRLKNKLGNFTINTLTGKIASEPKIETIGEIDNILFFDALQRLAKLCDPASAGLYPILGTVDLSFDLENKAATLMATDRYTLGEILIDFVPSESAAEVLDGRENLLLPYSSAVLIAPMKGSVASTSLVFDSGTQKFGYSFADGKVAIFSLQEAQPLQYRTLKEAASANTVGWAQVPTKELQKAIAVISSLVPEENDIYLELSSEKIVVMDANRTQELQVETLGGECEGGETVKFVRAIVNKAFSPIATANMNLRWERVESAFVFEPVLDDGTAAANIFILAIPSS